MSTIVPTFSTVFSPPDKASTASFEKRGAFNYSVGQSCALFVAILGDFIVATDTPIGRAEALIDSALSFREWKRVEELIIGEAGNLNMLHRIKVQSVFQEKPPLGLVQSCRADNCLILSNGDVYHCVLFSNSQDYRLGNVFSTPLSDIWQTLPDRLSTIVQQRISACSNDCWGGCPGMTYLLRGRVNTCDPRCEPHFGLYSSCIRQYHKFGEKEHDKEA